MSFQKVYENLTKGSSDLVSIFGRKPVPESGKAGDKPEWLMCALWNNQVLKEWQSHQETGSKLCTKMSIGRLLGQAIQQVDVDQFKLVDRMNWERDFVLVDIVGATLGFCGTKNYLRLQETPTADDPVNPGKFWDMVIFPECNEIVTEMTKLHALGIRSSVAIWNAFVTRYRKPWKDGKDTILGEIFLRNNYAERNVLTVVAFQHENVTEALISYYAGDLVPNVNGNIRSYHQFCDGPREEDQYLAIFSAKFMDNEDKDKTKTLEVYSDDEIWEFVGATEPNTPEGSEVSVDVLVGAAEQPYFIVREPLDLEDV